MTVVVELLRQVYATAVDCLARANRARAAITPPALKLVALAIELLRRVNAAAADLPRAHAPTADALL